MISPIQVALIGFTAIVAFAPLFAIVFGPAIIGIIGETIGSRLRTKTADRRQTILDKVKKDEEELFVKGVIKKTEGEQKPDSEDDWEQVEKYEAAEAKNGEKLSKDDKDWEGVVGFFHPFCNAGGGGERVLWAAIRATQKRWPKAVCVVYTGDHDVHKETMLQRVEHRFNIHIHAPTITFLYLTTRHYILASTWPHMTLLGQSLGSLITAYDAFSLLSPDIFIDTMGYAFALGLSKLLFPSVPTGAYVHYPTISTDMLLSLNTDTADAPKLGVNAGKGSGTRGAAKKVYWEIFAKLYSWVGSSIDVVMTNSTWTQNHINSLWGPFRTSPASSEIAVVYPPVAVEELEREIEVSQASEQQRENMLLYIAQFRPEKNHTLILNSFAEFKRSGTPAAKDAKLVLVGSVRDDTDSKRVYELRLLVNELHIKESVEFHLDASWPEILEWLRKSSVGVNGMWNEHFGIGVVEYQAAGLIGVVHDSGGPKIDIVTDVDGQPTGFHAMTEKEFAAGFEKALSLGSGTLAWRERARVSARRFTEEEFASRWIRQMEKLVKLRIEGPKVDNRENHFVGEFHM